MKVSFIAWIFVVFMIVLIFSFSSQSGASSVDTSGKLVDYIIQKLNIESIFDNNDWLSQNRNYLFRKMLHFTEYGILGALVFNALRFLKLKLQYIVIFSFFVTTIVAAFDEFYQTNIPGRNPQILDVLIDSTGALTIVIICLLISKLSNRVKCNNN